MKIREGIIEIGYCDFDDNTEENLNNWRNKNIPIPKIKGFSVSFWGFNEGCSFPCENKEEVKKAISHIKEHYKGYKFKIIDKRIKQKTLF